MLHELILRINSARKRRVYASLFLHLNKNREKHTRGINQNNWPANIFGFKINECSGTPCKCVQKTEEPANAGHFRKARCTHCNVEWPFSLSLFTSRRVLISSRIPDFAFVVRATVRPLTVYLFPSRFAFSLCDIAPSRKSYDRLSRGKTTGTKVCRLHVARRVASRSRCRRRGGAAALRNYSESIAT